MKRIAALVTVLFLLFSSVALADEWFCPSCGKENNGNYCTHCGMARADSGWTCAVCGTWNDDNYCSYCGAARYTDDEPVGVRLKSTDRLSTRSGPGTSYSEPGSFYQAGTVYTVLSQSGIWLQVELEYNGMLTRAYTGKKRFNPTAAQLAQIPKEKKLYTGRINRETDVLSGPGNEYTQLHRGSLDKNIFITLSNGRRVTVYSEEKGYLQIDFTYDDIMYRGWVPQSAVSR